MLKNIYLSIFYTVFMSGIYFCMLSNCDIVFNIFLQQDMGTKIQLPRFCSHLRTKITCHHLKLLLRILIKQFLLMSTLDQTLETLVTFQISTKKCYSYFGYTYMYNRPERYRQRVNVCDTLLAGASEFTPSEIEVFY